MKTCATCVHWRGDESTYQAPCGLEGNAAGVVAFDFGCRQWASKTPAKGGTFITTGPTSLWVGDTSGGNEIQSIAESLKALTSALQVLEEIAALRRSL